jgi:hypothetical protein
MDVASIAIHLMLNSLFCMGIWIITRDGFLLGDVAERARSKATYLITDPVFDCPPCMASLWGVLGYTLMLHTHGIPVFDLTPWLAGYLIYPITLSGLNLTLSQLTE